MSSKSNDPFCLDITFSDMYTLTWLSDSQYVAREALQEQGLGIDTLCDGSPTRATFFHESSRHLLKRQGEPEIRLELAKLFGCPRQIVTGSADMAISSHYVNIYKSKADR